MTRAEQAANNHRLRSMSKVGFIKGYKEAEEDIIKKLKEYLKKAEDNMDDECFDDLDDLDYVFWEGFRDCAIKLLDEFKNE